MALSLTYVTGTGITITNAETSIGVTDGTTTGVPQSLTDDGIYYVTIDGVANMVKGDEYRIRVYEKARSGGTQRVLFETRMCDAQSELIRLPPFDLGVGWDVTMLRVSSTSRAFDWRITRIS